MAFAKISTVFFLPISLGLILGFLTSPARAADEEDTPLQKEMSALSRSVRKLTRQYADASQKNSSLQLIDAMKKNVESAKTLTPSQTEKMPPADKAKFMETYHRDLDALEREVEVLKNALASDQADAVKAELDKLGQMKNKSHKELGVKLGPPGAHPEPSPSQTR